MITFVRMSSQIKLHILLFLCLASAFLQANSQTNSNSFYLYNQEQGLISSTISGIKKDNSGFIWLFSENGICRFDGYQFKNIQGTGDNSTNNAIRIKSFAFNSYSNNFLFVTQNQLAIVKSPQSTFTTLSNFKTPNTSCYFLNHQRYFVIHNTGEKKIFVYDQNGQLVNTIDIANWPACKIYKDCINNYLIILQNHKIEAVNLLNGKHRSVSTNENFNLNHDLKIIPKTSTETDYYLIYDKSVYTLKSSTLSLTLFQDDKEWQKILTQSTQNIVLPEVQYYLCKDQLIIVEHGKRSSCSLRIGKLINTTDFSIAKGLRNNIWILSKELGIFEYDLSSKRIITIETPQTSSGIYVGHNIEAILSDGENTWFSSPGNGLIKMERQTAIFKAYNPLFNSKEKPNAFSAYKLNIRSICNWEHNKVLIGSLKGLLIFNAATQEFEPIETNQKNLLPFKETSISNIQKDPEGDIWISSWNELQLSYLDKNTQKLKPVFDKSHSGIIKGTIRTFYFDSQGFLWIGTPDNAIYRCDWRNIKKNGFSKQYIEVFNPSNHETPSLGIVFGFYQADPNRLFIACENGLVQYHYLQKKFTLKSIHSNKKQKNYNIRAIQKGPAGIIWLGTNGQGLLKYDYLRDSCKQYTMQDGLGDNYVYSIQYSANNELWMGTNNGLSCFDLTKNEFRRYASKDGLQSAEFNTNASVKTNNQFLIFGGINGINCFQPTQLVQPKISNKLFVTTIYNNEKELEFSSQGIRLPYENNNLKIEFAALGHFRNSEYNYAYQLKGLSNEWINCGNHREATFLKIPAGKYKFKVKVSDCYGHWTELEMPLKITVLSPWYKSWWFYTFVGVAVLAIIGFIVFEKINRIKKLQEIRNNIAKDLHDEVGANLSNITLFLALIKQKLNKGNETEIDTIRLFEKIDLFAQSSQESMSDIVWMINAKNDQFQNLTIKMKDYANALSEDIPTKISFSIEPSLNQIKMDMLYRKNIYLFFKEAFNNALKYSKCTNITIEASLKNRNIILLIKDDGIGFDPSTHSKGNGINNMKKRAEQLNGKMNLESILGKGTSITLTCPYKENN